MINWKPPAVKTKFRPIPRGFHVNILDSDFPVTSEDRMVNGKLKRIDYLTSCQSTWATIVQRHVHRLLTLHRQFRWWGFFALLEFVAMFLKRHKDCPTPLDHNVNFGNHVCSAPRCYFQMWTGVGLDLSSNYYTGEQPLPYI